MMLANLILLLPCSVCLYSAITLFIRRKKNSRSQNIWMLCMLFTSVSSYIWSIYFSGVENLSLYWKLDIIDAVCGLTFFPFVRLYIKSITDETPIGWRDYVWFLPAVLIGAGCLIISALMGGEQVVAYMEAILLYNNDLDHLTTPLLKIYYGINALLYYLVLFLQIVLVTKYTITQFIRYKRRLGDFYSNPEGKSLENIKGVLIGTFILLVIFFLGVLEEFVVYDHPVLIYIIMLGYAGILYYLSYLAITATHTVENLVEDLRQSDREAAEQGYATIDEIECEQKSSSVIKKGRRGEIMQQIAALIDEDKLFLKKDLRLDDIVHLTKVNRTYISLLISEEYECSFSELINRKRIDYAQKLVSANPNLSHATISVESGFTHPSSFSRTFKQYTGMTFKEWHKENFGK